MYLTLNNVRTCIPSTLHALYKLCNYVRTKRAKFQRDIFILFLFLLLNEQKDRKQNVVFERHFVISCLLYAKTNDVFFSPNRNLDNIGMFLAGK